MMPVRANVAAAIGVAALAGALVSRATLAPVRRLTGAAERIAETCEKLAAEQNVAISMYVLDNDGNHVYMDRMDGQGYLNVVTAEMKARTALMQRGSICTTPRFP